MHCKSITLLYIKNLETPNVISSILQRLRKQMIESPSSATIVSRV